MKCNRCKCKIEKDEESYLESKRYCQICFPRVKWELDVKRKEMKREKRKTRIYRQNTLSTILGYPLQVKRWFKK